MTKYIAIFTFTFASILTLQPNTLADVPESQKSEVKNLLEFVETTGCTFERNGKKYNGERASKHIKRKYNHFRDKITTTEEFIEYSGTKSTISGNFYLVYCDESNPVKSRDWLLEELTRFRIQSG
ncbi:MAG: hypothetical protein E2O70_08305 [Candidatus Dadabacteria bacterium]|nr:MAG: hypothetical protein E2O70_08305 [Candidatus Dadabacteria bacterium]